jgi:hypothetical protein
VGGGGGGQAVRGKQLGEARRIMRVVSYSLSFWLTSTLPRVLITWYLTHRLSVFPCHFVKYVPFWRPFRLEIHAHAYRVTALSLQGNLTNADIYCRSLLPESLSQA